MNGNPVGVFFIRGLEEFRGVWQVTYNDRIDITKTEEYCNYHSETCGAIEYHCCDDGPWHIDSSILNLL